MIRQSIFKQYKTFCGGGKIEIMKGYIKKDDHSHLFAISRFFAERGCHVQITTNIHFKDEIYQAVFGGLIGSQYERKCPDLIIDGKFYEYESYRSPFKKEKISNMISKGLKQASRIIINNNKGASLRLIRKNIYNRSVIEQQHIDEVWAYEKGQVRLLYKSNREPKSPILVAEP